MDGHVRSKKRSYDSLARLEKYTSYASTGGTGTIRNELQYAYDGLMNVTNIKQSHEGAATTPGTLGVSFSYDSTLSGGGSGDVYEYGYRRNKVTYPSGRAVFYDFDTANAGDLYSRMSTVRRIRETNVSGTILSEYNYTGGGRPAIVDLPGPNVKLDHFQGTSGTLAGWDRFGRTRQQYWTGYSGTANVDRIYYDYDDASNRLYSDIDSAIHSGNNRDQVYTYDSAHRLKTFDQGTLSGSTITGTPTQEQDWSLDGLGNWSNYVTKTSGTTALNQDRAVNKVNEITDITESVGPAWVTPSYDAAGSMTTIPQPGSPTAGYTATYDAWHRLVKLAIGGTTVAEYEYDATKQRIAKKVYASGVLDYEHHYYYNDNWQVLETFPETGENEELPVASYVWHPYYIDALLLRDYDEDADGIVVRYYYTQDVNFNVLSILSSTGTVLERYGYTPYGQAEVLTASFTADSDGLSDSDNDITFTGQRYDSESRLMLYRHRYFHPVVGTFCSRDPVSYQGSEWNLYEYARGNPLAHNDPLGLMSDLIPSPQGCSEFLSNLNSLIGTSNNIPGIPTGVFNRLKRGGDYVFCGDCGDKVDNLSWNDNGRCRVCLGDGQVGFPDQWIAILAHELIHCGQYRCKLRGTPVEPGPPVPLPGGGNNPGGPTCGGCQSAEGRAYEVQCKFLFPGDKRRQESCIDAGICHSCAGPCKNDERFRKKCKDAKEVPFYPQPIKFIPINLI